MVYTGSDIGDLVVKIRDIDPSFDLKHFLTSYLKYHEERQVDKRTLDDIQEFMTPDNCVMMLSNDSDLLITLTNHDALVGMKSALEKHGYTVTESDEEEQLIVRDGKSLLDYITSS